MSGIVTNLIIPTKDKDYWSIYNDLDNVLKLATSESFTIEIQFGSVTVLFKTRDEIMTFQTGLLVGHSLRD